MPLAALPDGKRQGNFCYAKVNRITVHAADADESRRGAPSYTSPCVLYSVLTIVCTSAIAGVFYTR